MLGPKVKRKGNHGDLIFTMPHSFTTFLHIAPADRWNTDYALCRTPPPAKVTAEYIQHKSCFKISSETGFANRAEEYKKELESWFLSVRRIARLPSEGDEMALSPSNYISDDF